MESLGNLLYGFELALSPYNLFIAGTGVFLGAIIGVRPGLGGTSGVAILLPLTFAMPPPRLRSSSFLVFTGELYSAAPLPPSSLISLENHGRLRLCLMAIRSPSRDAPGWRWDRPLFRDSFPR
jgi:hypothetical protein